MQTAIRMREIQPSATLALTAKAKEFAAKGHPVISFAAGEPDFAIPVQAREALVKALNAGFTRYTPTSGTPDLKEAVKAKIKEDQGLAVDVSNIVISCGAKHSLYNLMMVLCEPGDEVIVPRPYWVSYPEMIKLVGAKPVFVDTAQTGFVMTAGQISTAITPKTRLVILNSPSNPTGAVTPPAEVEAIAALLVKSNIFAISDEIYEYYVFDGQRHVSVAQFMPDFLNRVAIVNGVSKSHAMTGLRIGYTVAHPDIIKKIGVLQDHSTSNPVSLSQKAATAALALGRDYKDNLRVEFQKKRDLMLSLLAPIKKLKLFKPQGAFYLFMSVQGTGLSPNDFSNRLLEEKFVATIPGESFGASEYVRLSYAASVDEITEGCKRIKEWVEAL